MGIYLFEEMFLKSFKKKNSFCRKLAVIFLGVIFWSSVFTKTAFSLEPSSHTNQALEASGEPEYVGEFLGVKVPRRNYDFVKATLLRFRAPWINITRDKQGIEETIWEQLILSFIAYQENITVSDQELEEKIKELMLTEKVNFDWRQDRQSYEKWVQERLKEPTEVFENQIKHLIQLEKLRKKIMDSLEPAITEEEVYAQFLSEDTHLSLELAQFATEEEADSFYKRVAGRPRLWEKEKKENPQRFLRPGLVSIAFLTDIWKIPQDALLKMAQKNIGELYPPRTIYKGYAVFKILEKRLADGRSFMEAREAGLAKIQARKKSAAWESWVAQLKREAKIRVYQKGGGK